MNIAHTHTSGIVIGRVMWSPEGIRGTYESSNVVAHAITHRHLSQQLRHGLSKRRGVRGLAHRQGESCIHVRRIKLRWKVRTLMHILCGRIRCEAHIAINMPTVSKSLLSCLA